MRVPLRSCPVIVNLGVSVHGARPVERYRLPDLWCLHLYGYHAGLEIDGSAVRIEPGVVTLVQPGAELRYRFRGASEHVYAHLRLPRPRRSDPEIPTVQKPATFPRLDTSLREAVGWLPNTPQRSAVRVWDVLWQLAEPAADEGDAVDRLRSAIEQRLNGPIVVGDLLDELDLGYSHNHVLRLFRDRTGHTIAGYIRQRRSDVAVGLLRSTSLPVKAIAAAVGVSDAHAFNKLLRQMTGRAPSRVRQDR